MQWRKKVAFVLCFTIFMLLFPIKGIEADQKLIIIENGKASSNSIMISESSELIRNDVDSQEKGSTDERYIVTYKQNVDKSILEKTNGKLKRDTKHVASLAVTLSKEEAEKLKMNPSILSVEPDIQVRVETQFTNGDVSTLQATYAWNHGYSGKGVKIAVLDSGIDQEHTDLKVSGGISYVDYTAAFDDDFGHGTEVATTIAAQDNQGGSIGVAPDAEMYAIKVLDNTGTGYLSDVIAGLDWAIDHRVDIVNMSFTTPTDSTALHQALDQAYASGMLLVGPAGNQQEHARGEITIQYPALYSSVIAVESASASYVSGYLALLKQGNPEKTNEQLRGLLNEKAAELSDPGVDEEYGFGLIGSLEATKVPGLQFPVLAEQSVSEQVYTPLHLNASGASLSPYVLSKSGSTTYDETAKFPSLENARSIAVSNGYYFVHYHNGVVLAKSGNKIEDNTSRFPTLVNAKAITVSNGYYYVLYHDGTILTKSGSKTEDITSRFPSTVNAKSIGTENGYYFIHYNDGSVLAKQLSGITENLTSRFPSTADARSISLANTFYFAAYLNAMPTLSVNNQNQLVTNNQNPLIQINGTVQDLDNDAVTISATLNGVTKSTIVYNSSTTQNWSLKWDMNTEGIHSGNYTGISINADNGVWGNTLAQYMGTIMVNRQPQPPVGSSPGSGNPASPSVNAGTTPSLQWAFLDPDAGDYQSAYDVVVNQVSTGTEVFRTGQTASNLTSVTVPSGKLNRGETYSWMVSVKDSKGSLSAYSVPLYFKVNSLPVVQFTSYTEGQTLGDNVLSFTWAYSDAEGQSQAGYRIQGSKDNWATIQYDSGVMSGAALGLQTPALSDGIWSFKIMVHDGLEWSQQAVRSNLRIPNAYEPNDTPAQAYHIDYGTSYSSAIASASDVDFFRYTAPKTGIDRLTLQVPSGLNYDVYIYDAALNLIGAGVRDMALEENVIFEVTEGSTYFIKVVGAGGSYSPISTYMMAVNAVTLSYQSIYQYDANGNIINKATTKLN